MVLYLPRKCRLTAVRTSMAFRSGLRGKALEWNWHNVLGIWCAVPLLIIVLTGVVMSFDWANVLLFRLAGSAPPVGRREAGDQRPHRPDRGVSNQPNYDHLFAVAKTLNPDWGTIT